MKLDIQNEVFNICTGDNTKSCEQTLEKEINLPDYCADIKKILKASVESGISSVSLSGERATAKGSATLRVVYLSEKDSCDVFEQSYELSFAADFRGIPEGAVVLCCAKTSYVNCRATGQRKLSLTAGIGAKFTCHGIKKESIVKLPDDGKVEKKETSLSCQQVQGFFEKTFDMGETVVLNKENPPVGKIISSDCRAVFQSSKLASGKLLIKGELNFEVLYFAEKDENTYNLLHHSMPISQIADVSGVGEDVKLDIRLKTGEYKLSVKPDSSGSNRLIEIEARVCAFISAFNMTEKKAITDCFCREYELETVFEKPDVSVVIRSIDESKQTGGSVELPDGAKKVLFVRCCENSESLSFTSDKAELSCSALLGIFYLDSDSHLAYCERNLDYKLPYAIVTRCGEPYGKINVCFDKLTFSMKGGECEVMFDLSVRGKVYEPCGESVLKKISLCLDKPKKECETPLTVYFAKEGEDLWDIAVSLSTSVRTIKEENSLEDDKIKTDKMLMISSV